MDEMETTATATANRLMLPWVSNEWEDTRALMGPEYWPYGVKENAADMDAICRYSVEQYLSPRRLALDELFHPDTVDLPGV
ncbi:MAG: hypothetical protein VW405_21935 [Rhodospirillaceae bacterium]